METFALKFPGNLYGNFWKLIFILANYFFYLQILPKETFKLPASKFPPPPCKGGKLETFLWKLG